MKKLLIIMMAIVMLTMPMALAEDLNDFDIVINTDPVMWNESVNLTIFALNETGDIYKNFSQTINIDWEDGNDTVNLTLGKGVYIIDYAPKGNFTITVNYNGTNETTEDSVGNYYEVKIHDISTISVEENQTANFVINVENIGTLNFTDGVEFDYIGEGIDDIGESISSLNVNQIVPISLNISTAGLNLGSHSGIFYANASGDYGEYQDEYVLTFNVVAPAEEKLFYIDEVEINGERYKLSDYEDNEDLVIEAKDIYGEDLEIKVIIKNDEDIQDIDDVELEIDIEDIDDEDDWDDDENIGTIKDGEEEEVTFTSSIDWTSDEDTFQVTVYVNGEGEDDGVNYEDEWTFDLKIDKEDDDIEITEAELDYSTVEAGDTAYLQIEITNIGADDQNDVVILVECDELDLDFLDKNIDLDEGDTYSITVPISVGDDVSYKSYNIDITVYYDWDEYMDEDLTDADKVTLTVEGEAEEEEEEEEYVPEGSVIIVPEETIPGQDIPTTEEISFRETTSYTILLVLGSVLLVIMIVFLLVQLFKH